MLSSRGSARFGRTLLGTVCFLSMLTSTRLGNVPINDRVIDMDPEKDQEEFARLRRRWDRLHALRVALNVTEMALFVSGALSEDDVPEGDPSSVLLTDAESKARQINE
jgi:hypothetical protein